MAYNNDSQLSIHNIIDKLYSVAKLKHAIEEKESAIHAREATYFYSDCGKLSISAAGFLLSSAANVKYACPTDLLTAYGLLFVATTLSLGFIIPLMVMAQLEDYLNKRDRAAIQRDMATISNYQHYQPQDGDGITNIVVNFWNPMNQSSDAHATLMPPRI